MPLPCELLPTMPPSVADRESAPSEAELTAAVILLAPRGAAWGTDEAGDGSGASPRQREYWGRIGAAFGHLYRLAFDTAVQAHPSAVATMLDEWESELGLPDPCLGETAPTEARVKAVRMKHAAIGGASPGYFICLARSAGHEIAIEEPSPFQCGRSSCGGTERLTNIELRTIWIVTAAGLSSTWFRASLSRLGVDPLGRSARLADLECLLRAVAPMHTLLIIRYT